MISIPQNAQDLENILDESMDEMAATQYFKSFVDAVTNEFVLMASLKGEKNIVSYEDHMVIEREGEIGWDILIKMELLTPLMKWCVEHPLSENDELLEIKNDKLIFEIMNEDNTELDFNLSAFVIVLASSGSPSIW